MAKIPSISMIPSGYKKDKIYSVLPTSGAGDFDFTRSSSATRVNARGLIETVATGVPRLEYSLLNGVVNDCPSLLLEPASTNLIPYSEDFSNANWSTSRTETPYISNVLSPEGTLNAYTLEISSGETSGGGVFKTGLSISGDNSFSVFAKKKTSKYLALGDGNLTVNGVWFDLENGTIGTQYNAIGEIEEFGNGWYKCTMKYTLTSSNAKFIYQSNTDGATSGGVVGGDSVYIFGAQLEQNSYATSYIPTSGSAVTRVADAASGSGDANTFNDSEGVLMAEIKNFGFGTNYISLNTGNNTQKIMIGLLSNSSIRIFVQGTSGDFFQDISSTNIEFNKILIKYKQNDFSLWINGFELYVNTSSITFNNLSSLDFYNPYLSGSDNFYGSTKQIQYYDSALNDSELETLTSWVSFTDMAQGQQYSIK